MTGGMHYTPSHTNIFSTDVSPEMLKLGRVSKVKVLFLVMVFVFNFDLFKFSAAILDKGLFLFCQTSNNVIKRGSMGRNIWSSCWLIVKGDKWERSLGNGMPVNDTAETLRAERIIKVAFISRCVMFVYRSLWTKPLSTRQELQLPPRVPKSRKWVQPQRRPFTEPHAIRRWPDFREIRERLETRSLEPTKGSGPRSITG